jgi:outer membrane protein assembly factor BamE (lipoprotein component of BamABCDE complex)
MKWVLLSLVALTGCSTIETVTPGMPASEVIARFGKPVAQGQLAGNEIYRDFSREPYGYYRVSFGPDERVRALRNLHTEENFAAIQPGMSQAEVARLVGAPTQYLMQSYAGGASSWTYRYRDIGIAKLLHVEFDAAGSVLRYATEWDPDVYSKGGARNDAP